MMEKLLDTLRHYPVRVVACSGGIDSLLLATIAHRQPARRTRVVHALSPAVPQAATERVRRFADREGWLLCEIDAGELQDPQYARNPVDRCYYCKNKLYSALHALQAADVVPAGYALLSGTNRDDLGDFRPGLRAAAEHGVVHPFVEAGIDKNGIRDMARTMGLDIADLPASPCLASRLYTGTVVTEARLRAVEAAEVLIKARAGVAVVRCRLHENDMLVEIEAADHDRITSSLLESIGTAARRHLRQLASVRLDPEPYAAGRAFVR